MAGCYSWSLVGASVVVVVIVVCKRRILEFDIYCLVVTGLSKILACASVEPQDVLVGEFAEGIGLALQALTHEHFRRFHYQARHCRE